MYAQYEEDVNMAVESFVVLTAAGREAAFARIKAAHESEQQRKREIREFEERVG